MTGNHNIVAMPGSYVHITSDADIQTDQPKWLSPRWAKVGVAIISALAGLGALAKAIYDGVK